MIWNKLTDKIPEEGKLLDTMSLSGIQQDLCRKGNLFFFPDMSMYVYYTPNLWRYKDE